MKRRELERHLRAHRAESDRIAAVPRHNEIKTGTVRAICNDLDIPTPRSR